MQCCSEKNAFCLFSTVIYQCEICSRSPALSRDEWNRAIRVLFRFFIAIFFSLHNFRWVLKKAQESQLQLLSQLFQDIATNCPRLYRKNHIYSLIHSHYGAISHEKECTFAAIEKQFIAFSCNIYTAPILSVLLFFSAVVREKNEWMKISDEKYVSFIEWEKINFLPLPRRNMAFRYWCCAIFYRLRTRDARDFDLIRWKKILKTFPRILWVFFCVCSPR